jgi:hypothetical protein
MSFWNPNRPVGSYCRVRSCNQGARSKVSSNNRAIEGEGRRRREARIRRLICILSFLSNTPAFSVVSSEIKSISLTGWNAAHGCAMLPSQGGASMPKQSIYLSLAILAVMVACPPASAEDSPTSKGSKLLSGGLILSSAGGDLFETADGGRTWFFQHDPL